MQSSNCPLETLHFFEHFGFQGALHLEFTEVTSIPLTANALKTFRAQGFEHFTLLKPWICVVFGDFVDGLRIVPWGSSLKNNTWEKIVFGTLEPSEANPSNISTHKAF